MNDACLYVAYMIFTNKGTMHPKHQAMTEVTYLRAKTLEDARSLAPSGDIYYLEQEWGNWMVMAGMEASKNADKAFWALRVRGVLS